MTKRQEPSREAMMPRPDGEASAKEQLHLRLTADDILALRHLAAQRGQTLSGAVHYLLQREVRGIVFRRQTADERE